MFFGTYSHKTAKYWNQTFFEQSGPGIVKCQILIPTIERVTTPHFLQKGAEVAKGYCIFSGKGRGDRALLFPAFPFLFPMAEVFFFDFGHLRKRGRGSNLDQKFTFWVFLFS